MSLRPGRRTPRTGLAALSLSLVLAAPPASVAQVTGSRGVADGRSLVPDLEDLVAFGRNQSELRPAVERYVADREALRRRYEVAYSPVLRARLRALADGWTAHLSALDFETLDREGRIDFVLLRNRIAFERAMLDEEESAASAMAPLVPFADTVRLLQERRRDGERPDPRASAGIVSGLADRVDELGTALRSGNAGPRVTGIGPVLANRAALWVDSLRVTLASWYGYHAGYDPLFTWWVAAPFGRAEASLAAYARAVRDLLGRTPDAAIVVGQPIGEAGLAAHLRHEMMPYSAEELLAIGEREFAWLEEELVRAAREMGFGDDWRAAQEAVKDRAVPPGDKPGVVLELARESEAFVAERAGITVPPLAREIWRMEMMSPEDQRINPFFRGGEVITVSYPTDAMTHEEKLMSMRGNNPHFNRATVHHELIPGHHLQAFMNERFNRHRDAFWTPFWREGWSLYWEMLLWERGFTRGPEDRIGMLFWRMHRAARIVFSLSFHLGRMTPQEAVDYLVERVGHERANAEAEVRRSFAGNYAPLYQAAYMIGGLQFRALHAELVESGRMTETAFHDAVLQGGAMPLAMVRARLMPEVPLEPDAQPAWRFADGPRPASERR